MSSHVVDAPPVPRHRRAVRAWLLGTHDLPAAADREPVDLETTLAEDRALQRRLWDSGFGRHGWPAEVGGLGGDARLRAATYEEVARAGYRVPQPTYTVETLSPALLRYSPALARDLLPPALAGDEIWCQGFSEPGAGSDLAALACRATPVAGGWRLDGHKIWSSFGHVSARSAVLARTGEPGHRGISMFVVDLAAPGVEVRPIRAAGGRREFAEIFFDGHVTPADRIVGVPGQGWEIAMYLLQWERGMYAWQRQATLRARLVAAVAAGGADPLSAARATVLLAALRRRSARTVGLLAAGGNPGPAVSVDKVLLSSAEQAVMDVVRESAAGSFLLGDAAHDELRRGDWFYSRAATIYGGSVDIQRTIVAERVLGLPRGAR